MKSPPWLAGNTARLSQDALRVWATANGYHLLFLDAASGNPRTGIVDAVLIRIGKKEPDELEIHLVQLKGGGAGLTPDERMRIAKAARSARIGAATAMWDRENMAVDFLANSAVPKPSNTENKRKGGKR